MGRGGPGRVGGISTRFVSNEACNRPYRHRTMGVGGTRALGRGTRRAEGVGRVQIPSGEGLARPVDFVEIEGV